MVYLINNPCTLPSSKFSLAISGIGKIIEAFQLISLQNIFESSFHQDFLQDTSCSFFSIPDGNTLLNMFGPWFFQACMMKFPDPGTQNGRAVAFGVLCKIFCLPQKREKFLRNYVTQFYLALIEGLHIDTCLSTILMSTTSLFDTELEGVRMMVPDFVVGIRMILPKLAPGFKIDLKFYMLELLLKSLKTESQHIIFDIFFTLINVYVVEDVAFCPRLVSLLVKSIQEKVLTMNLSSDVTLYAFDVFKDFLGYMNMSNEIAKYE
ncbi:hypothetical protein C2G38_2028136 [Gigaspora rosea]|uniref:Uncharacterized protein n=1 Tax=Gigaspora rosea TaxID=44941 RepID=A0A397W986_9GLOM|nr:hypothetical protein C2G38_2028136 [Gigaspora rosea]